VLRVPAFRNVWAGSVLSNGGTWFQAVAAGWLVLQITGSATMVGLLALAYRAPAFVLSAWGGKIADRYDWRRVGITTFSVEALGAVALGVLAGTGHLSVGAIFVATTVMGAAFAIGLPSVLALVPALVSTARLQEAVALNAAGINVARAIGPLLGGVTLAFAGATWCFLLNACSFLALVGALIAAPHVQQGSKVPERLRTALTYAMGDAAARRLLVGMFAFMVFAGPIQELAPVVARRVGGGPVALGLLLGAMGAGALAGAWALQVLSGRGLPRHLAIPIGTLGFGAALGVVAASPVLWVSVPGMLVAGSFWIWILTLTNTAIQLSSPSQMLGRMLGFYQLSVITPIAVGSVAFGAVAGALGIGWSLGIASMCLLAWGAWSIAHPVPEIDRDIRTIRS
jgi:predicted MFS family arabinose efflux permease